VIGRKYYWYSSILGFCDFYLQSKNIKGISESSTKMPRKKTFPTNEPTSPSYSPTQASPCPSSPSYGGYGATTLLVAADSKMGECLRSAKASKKPTATSTEEHYDSYTPASSFSRAEKRKLEIFTDELSAHNAVLNAIPCNKK